MSRGWLIEKQVGGSPAWWTGRGFSDSTLDGVRFVREEDAEAVIEHLDDSTLTATEHEWISGVNER